MTSFLLASSFYDEVRENAGQRIAYGRKKEAKDKPAD
jgi:hypothetical protein